MSIKRIFHDPIHKEIVFDAGKPEELMIMELIDTVAFQRLRRIKQLGAASLLFHGAESSRFTHSIGVFCIARKICKKLIESKSSFCENNCFDRNNSPICLGKSLSYFLSIAFIGE